MNDYRLLPLKVDDPSRNMAMDEAILKQVGSGSSPPTLRLYRWGPSAVSLGCFQGIDYEVDLEKAEENGIDVVRRISGGGTVFHDHSGEITYSIITPLEEIPTDVVESFKKVCKGLMAGFENLGLKASYKEINDVNANGKKISGSAQTRRYGGFLQHGTILVDPDIRLMFKVLTVSEEKVSDKLISSVKKRVTSLRRELGHKPEFEEVEKAMIEGFVERVGVRFREGSLSLEEKKISDELKEKYSSEEWTRTR